MEILTQSLYRNIFKQKEEVGGFLQHPRDPVIWSLGLSCDFYLSSFSQQTKLCFPFEKLLVCGICSHMTLTPPPRPPSPINQVKKLQAILKPMMLRRLKDDVEKNLAPKEETIIEVKEANCTEHKVTRVAA